MSTDSAIITLRTRRPASPVCLVTSTSPSILAATSRAASGDSHEMHAALEAVFEDPLAAAAGVDLGLHHQVLDRQPLGGVVGFLGSGGDFPLGAGHSEAVEELLGLVFVDVHGGGWNRALKRKSRGPYSPTPRGVKASSWKIPPGVVRGAAARANPARHTTARLSPHSPPDRGSSVRIFWNQKPWKTRLKSQ